MSQETTGAMAVDVPWSFGEDDLADSVRLNAPPAFVSGEKRLALALIEQAYYDSRMPIHGRFEGERIGSDGEPVLEIIGSGQWFLLDDTDLTYSHSFVNCCEALGLEPSFMRKEFKAKLRGNTLPKNVREYWADRAGLRIAPPKKSKKRRICTTQDCTQLTRQELCARCRGVAPTFHGNCLKCGVETDSYSPRRIYCEPCKKICTRDGCTLPRRRGTRVATCDIHNREERVFGVNGTKLGKLVSFPLTH